MVVFFFLSQAVAIIIAVVVLKAQLNRNLLDLAVRNIEAGVFILDGPEHNNPKPPPPVFIVISHKKLSDTNRERFLKAITKTTPGGIVPDFQVDKTIMGGVIVKAGAKVVDCSLKDKLRQAFS